MIRETKIVGVFIRFFIYDLRNFNFVAKIGVESGKHKFVGRSQLSPCRHFLLTPGAKYETINFRQPDISKYCQHTPSTYISNYPITFYHYFYRTRVQSLFTLVSDSLNNSLTNYCLVNLIDVTLSVKMPTQDLLRLLLLLILMLRIMSSTAC